MEPAISRTRRLARSRSRDTCGASAATYPPWATAKEATPARKALGPSTISATSPAHEPASPTATAGERGGTAAASTGISAVFVTARARRTPGVGASPASQVSATARAA